MGKEILIFGNIENEKKKFFFIVIRLLFCESVDIEKVLVSNKISFGEKNNN